MSGEGETKTHAITGVLDRICEAGTGETVTVEDMLATIGRRGFGPLIMLIGLISLTPIGSIPGASILFGTLILLIVGQVLLGRAHPWMPRRILRLGVRRDRVRRAVRWITPYAAKMEGVVRPRLLGLSGPTGRWFADLACVLKGLLMYPLSIVPYGVTLPSAALFALGLGMTTRDGALIIAGLAFTAAGVAAPYFLLR